MLTLLAAPAPRSQPEVVTKYQAAAEITNRALAACVAQCKPGARVAHVCQAIDALVEDACEKTFNKQKGLEKGLAFPCCLSVNEVAGHFSPPADDPTELAEGDVVKIDLGCHIDGWIAVGAHTMVVQADPSKPVTGRAADLLAAAQAVFEVALRTVKPGATTAGASDLWQRTAEAFGCNVCEGVLSHALKRYIIDGNKVVLGRPVADQRVEEHEIEELEAYAIDVLVSTGEGKLKVMDEKRTTVFKRALQNEYKLKMKASRAFFSEVNRRFPTTPFTLRALEDQRTARLGLVECINHELLMDYPVLHEKPGELVAHLKATVLLMPNGSHRVVNCNLQPFETDKKVEDQEILDIMAQPVKKKKKSGKKAKAKAESAQ